MRRPCGLTLAEIVLTLGLMAVLLLVVVGVFTKLMMSSVKSTDLTTASTLAQTILEHAVRQGPPEWGIGGDFSTTGGRAEFYTHDTNISTKFVYQVKVDRATTPPESSMGTLYNIKVIVNWWGEEADRTSARPDLGRLSTELTRMVYVEGTP